MSRFPAVTELRSAVRALWRAPAVSFSAILCIALGLGATTALSSAIDRALLRPLPFRAPEQLVTVYRTTPQFDTGPFSAPNYVDLARDTKGFDALAAIAGSSELLTLPNDALRVDVKRVTGNLFPMLGAHARLGRLVLPEDDAPSQAPVVVLGEQMWRDRFNADPRVVGTTIRLDGRPTTVIGVVSRDFGIPSGSKVLHADMWVPMRFTPQEMAERRSNFLPMLARLAPNATMATAGAELARGYDRLVAVHPELRGDGARIVPMHAESVRSVRTPLLLLFGAVCIVLLIATTNVGSLLLARGVQRERELAVRLAIGGQRWDVMRPVLVESVVLTAVGLALGIALAWAGVRTIGALAASRMPPLEGLGVNGRVVALAVLLSVFVAAVCGLIPAWRGATVDPQHALRGARGAGGGRNHHRLLGALVVAQVSLSLVLLIGAGLVLRGFAGLLQATPGFDTAPVLTMLTTVADDRYPDGSAQRRFLEPALAAIQQVPNVAAAGSISLVPYVDWGVNSNVHYEGRPVGDLGSLPIVEARVATPGFFAVTRQRLLAGRLLTDADDERPTSPAVVVANEALVRRDFKGLTAADVVGKRYHTGDTTFATIVGVVSDIRNFGPYDAPHPEMYLSSLQNAGWSTTLPIMVRVQRGDPTAVASAVRAAIRSIDPQAAVTELRPMSEVVAKSVGRPRFYLVLLGSFAAVAVALAVAGIYGVLSYAVAQRTREFGIRSALGSSAQRTATLVARQGARLILLGVAIGLLGGVAVTRLMRAMLYGVSPLDPLAWSAACAVLAVVGIAAVVVPALRATRAEPILAMRAE